LVLFDPPLFVRIDQTNTRTYRRTQSVFARLN